MGVPGATPGRTAVRARPSDGARVHPGNADQREDCEQNATEGVAQRFDRVSSTFDLIVEKLRRSPALDHLF